MANHKSALKAIRKSEKRRLHNRYYAKTMRNAVRQLRAMTNKEEAAATYPDRKSTRLNSSHYSASRMPSSA